jgi:hypothetical protein
VEVTSDENPFKQLLKKEQRLLDRLQEEQEAEARAQDRFQRAQTRLQRRRRRLERIQRKLVRLREQLAELQITDHQPAYRENELVVAPTSDPTGNVDSEQDNLIPQEPDDLSPFNAESSVPDTSAPEHEIAPVQMDASDAPAVDDEWETVSAQEYQISQQDTTSAVPIEIIVEPEPEATLDSIAVESEAAVKDEDDISSEPNIERKPTKPLRLEQPELPVAESQPSDVQSAKEAWIAAESSMQKARNAAHGIAASISFLSQTDGLSNEFIEELVRKQADANKELLKAQDAARLAYERFVQAQRDSLPDTNRLVDVSSHTSEASSQQNQENTSLPPVEENGLDQTAKLHAVRLYTEW